MNLQGLGINEQHHQRDLSAMCSSLLQMSGLKFISTGFTATAEVAQNMVTWWLGLERGSELMK